VYDLSGQVKDEEKPAPIAPAGAAVGSVAATEVESIVTQEEKPEVKPEEKTVHSLFSFEEPTIETPEAMEETHEIKEETPAVDDDEPLFEPTVEATPMAPAQETQPVTHYEEERPSIKVFDNPFRSSGNDDEGFEITSRIITQEEVQAKAEQEVAVIEAKKAKASDPKEELKKQRLRALSMNFRTAKGLEELENQPAYLRRNVDINTSDDHDLSNYSASKNGISGENSYLHGNVD
jgi:cell division protein FtsZ